MYPKRNLEVVAFVGQIEQVDYIRRRNRTRQDKDDKYGQNDRYGQDEKYGQKERYGQKDRYGQNERYGLQQFGRSPAGCIGYVPQIWDQGNYDDHDKLGNDIGNKGIGYKVGEKPGSAAGSRTDGATDAFAKEHGDLAGNPDLFEKLTDKRMNKTSKRPLAPLGLPGPAIGLPGLLFGPSRTATSRFSGLADLQRHTDAELDTGFGSNAAADLGDLSDLGTDFGTDLETASASQYSTLVNLPTNSGRALRLWKTDSGATQSPGLWSLMEPSESSRASPPVMLLSGLNGSEDSYGSNALQAFASSPWGISRLSIWMTPHNASEKIAGTPQTHE